LEDFLNKQPQKEDAIDQFDLAKNYFEGKIVKKDPIKAFELYRESAAKGYHKAQYTLGMLYKEGHILKGSSNNHDFKLKVPQDYELAYQWLRNAALQGNKAAQYEIGKMLIEGEGVKNNMERAKYWIKAAFNNGHEKAEIIWETHELWKYDDLENNYVLNNDEDIIYSISLKKLLFSFKGRIDLTKFWGMMILLYALLFFLLIIGTVLGGEPSLETTFIVTYVFVLWPKIALGVKRCHDRNRSGTFLLYSFAPILNILVLIELFFRSGSKAPNQWGSTTTNKKVVL